jgi:hypothetical protein
LGLRDLQTLSLGSSLHLCPLQYFWSIAC